MIRDYYPISQFFPFRWLTMQARSILFVAILAIGILHPANGSNVAPVIMNMCQMTCMDNISYFPSCMKECVKNQYRYRRAKFIKRQLRREDSNDGMPSNNHWWTIGLLQQPTKSEWWCETLRTMHSFDYTVIEFLHYCATFAMSLCLLYGYNILL